MTFLLTNDTIINLANTTAIRKEYYQGEINGEFRIQVFFATSHRGMLFSYEEEGCRDRDFDLIKEAICEGCRYVEINPDK